MGVQLEDVVIAIVNGRLYLCPEPLASTIRSSLPENLIPLGGDAAEGEGDGAGE